MINEQNIQEEWKEISHIRGIQASSLGRIRTRYGDILPQSYGSDGHLRVRIGSKYERVHRLVASAFHGYRNGMDVRPKNGILDDNRSENLEWIAQGQRRKI